MNWLYFFLTPIIITVVVFFFLWYVRYKRERDLFRALGYFTQKEPLFTILIVFVFTSLMTLLIKLIELL